MKSLLFQDETNLIEPSGCGAEPCREEVEVSIRKNGRLYNFVLRDKVVPEDAYLLARYRGFPAVQALRRNSNKPLHQILVKNNVII